jgi:hypothetical protein
MVGSSAFLLDIFWTFFCHFAKRKGPTTSSKAFRKFSNKIPEESYEITKKIGRF